MLINANTSIRLQMINVCLSDEYTAAPLGLGKQGLSFKDYVQERNEPLEQGKPVIPAAVLAGFTGECRGYSLLISAFSGALGLIKLLLFRKWTYPAVAVPLGAFDRHNLPEHH